MTIPTEKLKERIEYLRNQAADVKWVTAPIAQEMLEMADALSELLAVREAQLEPVQWGAPKTVRQLIQQLQTLDQDLETTALLRMPADFRDGRAIKQVPLYISYERLNGQWLAQYKGDGRLVLAFWAKADDRPEGERGELFTAPHAQVVPSERLIGIANHISRSVGGLPDEWQDWATEIASDLRRLAISMPAPAYPEKLPCAVHLLPGLKFGTGIATKTLLEALARREKYNLDISAMTVVERGEHFAKTMRPQSDHLNSAIKLAEEASKLADRIREEELTPPSVQTDELVMQIRRLVHSLKKAKPDSLLVQQVTEYMKRHGYFKATDCLRGEVEGKN